MSTIGNEGDDFGIYHDVSDTNSEVQEPFLQEVCHLKDGQPVLYDLRYANAAHRNRELGLESDRSCHLESVFHLSP